LYLTLTHTKIEADQEQAQTKGTRGG